MRGGGDDDDETTKATTIATPRNRTMRAATM
jgi:hypothetical protein